MKTFLLFHLNLSRRQSLFGTPDLTRQEQLESFFRLEFTFKHRNGSYLWVPYADVGVGRIIGTVLRQLPRKHHLPPELGADETETQEWQGAFVLLDTTSSKGEPDGQRLAFEIDPLIGRPASVLRSLLNELNSRPNRAYDILEKEISDVQEFRKWANERENRLKSLTLDFAVPNMWDSRGAIEKDLESYRRLRADNVKKVITSREGLDASDKSIEAAVDYGLLGAGTVKATAMDGTKFDSNAFQRRTTLPAELINESSRLEVLKHWFGRLMGKQ